MSKSFGNTQDLVDIKEIREGTVLMKNGGLRAFTPRGPTMRRRPHYRLPRAR